MLLHYHSEEEESTLNKHYDDCTVRRIPESADKGSEFKPVLGYSLPLCPR